MVHDTTGSCLRDVVSGLHLSWKVYPGCKRKNVKTYQTQGLPPTSAALCIRKAKKASLVVIILIP